MTRVRIKICGLTREQDVISAVEAGADALGFVFAPGSKRELAMTLARELVRLVPAFVTRVGLFMDQEPVQVERILQNVPLELLQFHGTESGAYCRQFNRPYIKAISGSDTASIDQVEAEFADAAGLLMDSHSPGEMGGTGRVFDWSQIQHGRLPLILAGGLNPDNVAAAVQTVNPWAVDVASGVEHSPGIKNEQAMRRFVKEAKREY